MMHVYRSGAVCLILFAVVLAAGCSTTTTPKTRYYLIAPDYQAQTDGPLALPPHLSVDCAPFLNQGGLVLENSDQTIQTAHYHRWAEPLSAMIARYLQRQVQERLAPGIHTPSITVLVDQFHQRADGTVVYSGQWWTDTQPPRPFRYQHQLPASGYDITVSSLHQLLDSHSQDMAQALDSDTLARME